MRRASIRSTRSSGGFRSAGSVVSPTTASWRRWVIFMPGTWLVRRPPGSPFCASSGPSTITSPFPPRVISEMGRPQPPLPLSSHRTLMMPLPPLRATMRRRVRLPLELRPHYGGTDGSAARRSGFPLFNRRPAASLRSFVMPRSPSSRDRDRRPAPRNDQSPQASRGRLVQPAAYGALFAWFSAAPYKPYNLWALAAGAVLAASVLYGVVYPAIWSRRRKRRRAARRVLRDLLRWTLGRL